MNTSAREGAFTKLSMSIEKPKDEVISLSDNFGPFNSLVESEGEMENLEAKIDIDDGFLGELLTPYQAPNSEEGEMENLKAKIDIDDGFGGEPLTPYQALDSKDEFQSLPPFIGSLECKSLCTGAFDSVSMSDERGKAHCMGAFDSVLISCEKDKAKRVASNCRYHRSLELDMLLEFEKEMGNDTKHGTWHQIQHKYFPSIQDGKDVGVASINHPRVPCSELIELSDSEGEMDNNEKPREKFKVGELVTDELAPMFKDQEGMKVATQSHCMSTARANRHGSLSYAREVAASNYKMSYCELLHLRPQYESMFKKQCTLEAPPSASFSSTTSTLNHVHGSKKPSTGSKVLKPYSR